MAMLRAKKDFALAHLADEIGERVVIPDPDGSVKEQLKAVSVRGFSYRGCQIAPPHIFVRFTIARAQRAIAKFPISRQLDAVRFADAAIVHFWKYRKTTNPCVDADTTLGVALTYEVPGLVVAYLNELEDHFKRRGYLDDTRAQHGLDPDVAAVFKTHAARKNIQQALGHVERLQAELPLRDFSHVLGPLAQAEHAFKEAVSEQKEEKPSFPLDAMTEHWKVDHAWQHLRRALEKLSLVSDNESINSAKQIIAQAINNIKI